MRRRIAMVAGLIVAALADGKVVLASREMQKGVVKMCNDEKPDASYLETGTDYWRDKQARNSMRNDRRTKPKKKRR